MMLRLALLSLLLLVPAAVAAQPFEACAVDADGNVDRDGVAQDIIDLATYTRCADPLRSFEPIFVFRGDPDCLIQERHARKLDADPVREGQPRRGAATKILQGKDLDAIDALEDYIAAIDKSKIAAGSEEAAASLQSFAAFLIGCIGQL